MISLSIGFRLNEFQKVSVSMLLFLVSVILEVDMVSGLSTRVWMGSCCDSPSVGSPPRVSPLSGSKLHVFSCMVPVCGSSFCLSSSSTPCFSLIKQMREFRENLIQNVKKQQCCAE